MQEASTCTHLYGRGGFTSAGQESRCAFRAVMYKIHTQRKHYIESQRSKKLILWRWRVHCTAISWSCICPPKVGHLIDIWKPSICTNICKLIYSCHAIWREVKPTVYLQDLKNIKNVKGCSDGMVCHKICKEGRDDIIVKVNLQSPNPTSFYITVAN